MASEYTAHIAGSSWSRGPTATFRTLTEARQWAESYGTTADECIIEDSKGHIRGVHCRDRNGNGTRWYRAPAYTF